MMANTNRNLFCKICFAALVLVSFASRTRAQSAPPTQITPSNDTGTTPFGSYSTDAGNVNLSNGNLSLNIPLISLPGRNGTNFTLGLQYDSKIWTPSADYVNGTNVMYQWKSEKKGYWVGDLGWHLTIPFVDPGVLDVDQLGNTVGLDGSTLTLSDGSKHYLVGRAFTLDAQDGSGITANNDANHNLISAQLKDGSVVFGSGHLIEDTNGNYISTTFTDTLGRQIVATSASGQYSSLAYKDSNGATQTITFTYTSIPLFQTSGPYQTPQPPFTYPQATNCQGICHVYIYVNQPSAGSATLLTGITLPDNTQYTFAYNGYGELTKITYPTGGYTAYTYAPFVHLESFWSSTGFNIKGDFREVTARKICRDPSGLCGGAGQTPEDITNFTPTISVSTLQPNNAAMDVVDPMGYKNHYEFSQADAVNYPWATWPRETLHSVYSETGALLRTTQTSYAYLDFCTCPAYPQDVTTTLNDTGGTTLVTKTHYDYDTFQLTLMWPPYNPANGIDYENQTATNRTEPIDNPIQVLEYNYGSGAVGTLARKTVNTWLKVNAANSNVDYSSKTVHIWNRKATSQIWDAGTTKFAETDYEYDNYAVNSLSASGAVQHDSAYGITNKTRGNLTAIKRWRNTDGAMLTTTFAYDDAGNAIKAIDPLSYTTLMSYADAWGNATCTPTGGNGAAYLTAVNDALGHTTQGTYNSCTGSLASVKNQNDINAGRSGSTYSHDLMGRTTLVSYPDGGSTTNCYTDVGGAGCLQSGPPYKSVTTRVGSPSPNVITTTVYDGLGRVSQTQINSASPIYTDTTYDPVGRIYSVKNPHFSSSSPTDGTTTYTYDALNRPKSVIKQDGSSISMTYSGNCTTVTDEASKSRTACSDALGRLTQVTEDPGSNPHFNYVTNYTYDALNNLTSVVQNSSRQRTFSYDSLSRLVCASNPENSSAACPTTATGYTTGTTGYSYDANGNLFTKTSPAPNQTGTATVTTTYSYDALNRLTGKSYSDTNTPAPTSPVGLQYDQATSWGPITNPIGRLTTEYSGTGSASTGAEFSYDPMGRIVLYAQCTPSNCGSGSYNTAYTYDLAGNMASLAEPQVAGITLSYSYDGAARPTKVTSTLVDAQHPATVYALDPSIGYFPNGSLRKATLANGLTESTMYNNRLQPCRIEINSAAANFAACSDSALSGNVLDFTYGYNSGSANNGNVALWSAVGNQTFSRSYTYDSLNRLSTFSDTAAAQPCKGMSWTYDAWGNRTDQNVTSGSCYIFHALVGTNSRLGSPYQYDAAGNMTFDGTHSYTYDAENRVTQVDGGATATYVYDAQGHRVRKNSGGTWSEYVYDTSGNVLAEWKNTVGWLVAYVYVNGRFIAQYQNNTTYSIFSDHLGSTRLMTNLDHSIYDSLDFDPFGEQIAGDTGTTHKFTGKERDPESGLDNFGARFDSSTLGRFMSPDPVTVSWRRMVNPQIWNAYSYAGNNPLRFVDPTGEELVQLGQHTDDEIKKRKNEIKQELKNKDLSKEQKDALKKERNTLDLEQQGNHVVAGLLADLDKTGQRNGLQLSNFTLSTDTKNDFAAGHPTPEAVQKLLGAQAFVLQGNAQFGGTIYIRTEPSTGFYQMSQGNSDFGYYGASALSHEQVHLNGGGEYPAFQRQESVFQGFEKFFQNPALYRGLDESIRDGIKANQPQ